MSVEPKRAKDLIWTRPRDRVEDRFPWSRHANLILAVQEMDLRDDRAVNSEDDLFAELERITNGHFWPKKPSADTEIIEELPIAVFPFRTVLPLVSLSPVQDIRNFLKSTHEAVV